MVKEASHLYLAVLEEKIPHDVIEELSHKEEVHSLSEYALLIRSSIYNPSTLRSELGIGMPASKPRIGIVFRLNGSYSGYHYEKLLDWLSLDRGAPVGGSQT